MSQQIYSIQLLNDLHNYFPEILYNPGRFQNVQDLLTYIRSVASFSPYDRGLQQYRRQNSTYIPRYGTQAPPTPIEMARLYPTQPINSTIPITYVTTTVIDESNNPQTTYTPTPLNTNTNDIINNLINGLFTDILGTTRGGINLNSFLNERVQIYPTNEEIARATSQLTATVQQEDICAICQDDIDINQEMRRINHCGHYFHRNCIDTWFSTNVHCPTCRHDIREIAQNNRNNTRNNERNSNPPPPVPENHRRTNIRQPDNA